MNGENAEIDAALRPPKLIVVGLMTGLVSFGVVSAFISGSTVPDPAVRRILSVMLCVFPVAEIVAYCAVRRGVTRRLRQAYGRATPTADVALRLIPVLSTLTIIGTAMAEGFGLFGLVVFVITRSTPVLLAPAVAVLALAVQWPTRAKLARLVSTVTGQTWY